MTMKCVESRVTVDSYGIMTHTYIFQITGGIQSGELALHLSFKDSFEVGKIYDFVLIKRKGYQMNNDKGKNFSLNNTGKRKENDLYETPYSMTQQLLKKEFFDSKYSIVEPAAGNGAIVRVLEEQGWGREGGVLSYDLNVDHKDFLFDTQIYYQLITNPPYSKALEFILHAKEVVVWKFAMLLPLSYLHGQKRYETLWQDFSIFSLRKVYVFTRYPMLGNSLREDGKYETGMQVYAWYIWQRNLRHETDIRPIVDHIDNNRYVCKKKDTE